MKRSWRMTRIAGVDIDIHWSFSFVIIWVMLQGAFEHRELYNIALAIGAILLVFGCILLHEIGHAMMALSLKVDVRKIVLLPFGGVAQIQSVPEKPVYELLIALTGPLVNLAIAILVLPFLVGLSSPILINQIISSPIFMFNALITAFFQQGNWLGLMVLLIAANLSLFAFNLIPIFPMDGGRIVRATLTLFFPYLRALQVTIVFGYVISFLCLMFAFQRGSPLLFFLALFAFAAAYSGQIK